jgi:hypothetical protein
MDHIEAEAHDLGGLLSWGLAPHVAVVFEWHEVMHDGDPETAFGYCDDAGLEVVWSTSQQRKMSEWGVLQCGDLFAEEHTEGPTRSEGARRKVASKGRLNMYRGIYEAQEVLIYRSVHSIR